MCKSAYIHIPFCKTKCNYCSFVSGTDIGFKDLYINALIQEIENYYNGELLKTVYFGGGTPSLLSAEDIYKIISLLKFDNNTEITIEINPDDADYSYLESLKKICINRLSFGAQTFNDEILKFIGRRHSSEAIVNAIKNAKELGFENISLDLMYGLPFQTIDKLKTDLDLIRKLNLEHISTYGLKIEPPSYFSKHLPSNLPDDDKQAEMYLIIAEILKELGYKHYEVSNFAKIGYESKHNLNYWNNAEYYGFGVAAHGYVRGNRYSNLENLNVYLSNPLGKSNIHNVTLKEKIEEEIFLGFRRASGININEFKQKYGIDFYIKYKDVIKKYEPKYIENTDDGYKLTLKGVMLSNIILADFIE